MRVEFVAFISKLCNEVICVVGQENIVLHFPRTDFSLAQIVHEEYLKSYT